ncbi:sodium-independent sulfate anion transporter-like isoform X2 [Pieris napi]|uniref:sodium-independent sulfate anion transporter-like isoform X2 n=1 Tax=Pieris napi TaxID=78633 RepID=UPI001FBB2941|nr:sodium-independent sulfate anion transporter-like isoform X2 [Pieris napi]
MEEGIPLPKRSSSGGWYAFCKRRLPILEWAPKYDQTKAVADLIAGITLGLTLVPQSIAYASLANLPVQYGLYSGFMGTILYMFLGTVKEVSIGPTSLMALMTLQTCRGLPVDFVVLLAFLSGCVVFVMGLLRLGFLVDLISPSVTSGFTSATAVTIIASQKFKDIKVNHKRYKLKKALWLISIARNALVVCIASTVAFCTFNAEKPLFKLSGRVEPGLPQLSLPPFSTVIGNQTVGFMGMMDYLGSAVIVTPVVMVLANIAIAKAFSPGGRVDATQEMVTLGLCNVAGSLVHAMPSCGAFTRSAVSHSSGVRTPAAGLYSGIITLLALNFLTQYFFFIPKACLSSVLICAVVFMVDINIIGKLWNSSKRELVLYTLTFGAGIWKNLELSILVGALTGLAFLIRDVLQTPVDITQIKTNTTDVIRVSVRRALVYANAERFAALVINSATARCPVLIECSAITLCDYTATEVLSRLVKKFQENDQLLVFYNASKDSIKWLETVSGIDKRTLKVTRVQEALDAVSTRDPEAENETSALLKKSLKREEIV